MGKIDAKSWGQVFKELEKLQDGQNIIIESVTGNYLIVKLGDKTE